jgi:hypothetical protein
MKNAKNVGWVGAVAAGGGVTGVGTLAVVGSGIGVGFVGGKAGGGG